MFMVKESINFKILWRLKTKKITGWLSSELTHNICRMFSEGFHKVRAVPNFWEHSEKIFHKVSVIYMFSKVSHKTGNNLKYIKLKMACMNWGWWAKLRLSQVIWSVKILQYVWGNDPHKRSEKVKKTFLKNIPRTFQPNVLWMFLCRKWYIHEWMGHFRPPVGRGEADQCSFIAKLWTASMQWVMPRCIWEFPLSLCLPAVPWSSAPSSWVVAFRNVMWGRTGTPCSRLLRRFHGKNDNEWQGWQQLATVFSHYKKGKQKANWIFHLSLFKTPLCLLLIQTALV